MYKKILGIMVIACSFLFYQAAWADEWGCGEGLKKMVTELQLDQSQKDKIQAAMDQMKSKMKEVSSQMDDLDKQIKQEVNSDQMNPSNLGNLVDQKAKLIGDMIKAKLATQIQVLSVLTPEQKTDIRNKLQALEDKIHEKYKSCHEDD